MNELYVERGWIYFKTNKKSAWDAINDLMMICEKNGIELIVEKAQLRNEDGLDISEVDNT